jgi:hypothetical protein
MRQRVKSSLFAFLVFFTVAVFGEAGVQEIAAGKKIHFGQDVHEVEHVLGKISQTNSAILLRKGIDREIVADSIRLEFDAGRLCTMEFDNDYKSPLTPFRKKWMNFDQIGTNAVQAQMSKQEFLTYLENWEKRAKGLEIEKVEQGDLRALNDHQYSVQMDEIGNIDSDPLNRVGGTHIAIRMGTAKRSSQGGLWENGWSIFFSGESPQEKGHVPGTWSSITAIGDTVNY